MGFKADQLKEAFKNVRSAIPGAPGAPQVMDAQGRVQFPAIQPIPPTQGVNISVKCSHRLKIVSVAFHYYRSIGRAFTFSNLHYQYVLKDFYVEWEAIVKLSKEDKPEIPKLSKNMTPLRWIESFKDCLYRAFGVRNSPLSYVICEDAVVPNEVDDPLSLNKAYGSSGSVVEELIKRMKHEDPLFKTDNGIVYYMLEEASRGTIYATTIKPFARNKDGKAAWKAMCSYHVGKDKW